MAQWQNIGLNPPDELTQLAEDIKAVIDSIQTVLTALSAAIGLLAGAPISLVNFLLAIVGALIALLEQLLAGLYTYGASIGVHLNANWNPNWKWRRGLEDNPLTTPDFKNDNAYPWQGTGMDGWLEEVLYSTEASCDPLKPLSDTDTSIFGWIIVKGVSQAPDLPDLLDFLDFQPDYERFREILDISLFDSAEESWESLTRFGSPALGVQDCITPNAIKFTDLVATTIGAATLDTTSLLADEIKKNALPVPGAYPKWVKARPMDVFPPFAPIAENLRNILGLLTPGIEGAQALSDLLGLVQARLDKANQLLEETEIALTQLIALLGFLPSAHIIVIESPTGGIPAFISQAYQGEGKPNFGEHGIVLGVIGFVTAPDYTAAVQSVFELVGISVGDYLETESTRSQQLAETFDTIF